MALHLIRCHRILHLTGMQNNIRKRGLQSVLSCNSKSQDTKSISHRADIMRSLLNHNVSELEYSGIRRPFHSSVPLLKKFDTKDYETLRILDPAGMFLCNSELYVLKKFCQQYKRFTYDEVKPDGENTANLDVGDGRLRVFKLSDKREGKSTDSKDTKTKIIKFHKEKSVEGGKADKIIELLVDQGKVNIMFDERVNITYISIINRLRIFSFLNIYIINLFSSSGMKVKIALVVIRLLIHNIAVLTCLSLD